ncbi:MAG: transposase [Niastella sp.]|nr:transposase [Niastella sp.]
MKQSYHPAVLVAYYLNCLPGELKESIPRSTKYGWAHKPLEACFGYEWACENQHLFSALQEVSASSKLLKVNLALLRIIAIKRFLVKYREQLRKRIFYAPETVLENIEKLKSAFTLTKALKHCGIDFRYYKNLKAKTKCAQSLLQICRLRHPAQLLKTEVQTIASYCSSEQYRYWPLISIYQQMKRDAILFISKNCFYKYVSLLNIKRSVALKRRKNHVQGIRAGRVFEILHADVTLYTFPNGLKAYIYLLMDNFSRAILSYRVSAQYSASYTKENLKEAYEKYLNPSIIVQCSLITDDGSENHGLAAKFLSECTKPSIKQLFAQKTITQSNSMIEAVNKSLKYGFLYHQAIPDLHALEKYVPLAIQDRENRPHDVLNGLTPLEVLNGSLPSSVNFASQTANSIKNRIAANKKENCCGFSF